jgi:hypothetical protein
LQTRVFVIGLTLANLSRPLSTASGGTRACFLCSFHTVISHVRKTSDQGRPYKGFTTTVIVAPTVLNVQITMLTIQLNNNANIIIINSANNNNTTTTINKAG